MSAQHPSRSFGIVLFDKRKTTEFRGEARVIGLQASSTKECLPRIWDSTCTGQSAAAGVLIISGSRIQTLA
ncbi:MAG TPA: hypothetical protein VF786_03465 [Terriglobales bacterium]